MNEAEKPSAMSPLGRDEAWTLLTAWTPTEALRRHARAVELVMRAAAHRYGAGAEDEERWGLAGLLHDADYDRWPDEHPARIVAWLRQRGEPELAHAIAAHYTGWGVPYEESYPALLAELSGREVINAGIPGEVTAQGLGRLADTLDEFQPQLLILCLGGNDMLHKRDAAAIRQNLERMVAISRERGVPVLLLGVPRPALFGMESADFYATLAEVLELPLEGDALPEILADNRLKSDPIHPNAAGYRLLAETLYQKLRESGAL